MVDSEQHYPAGRGLTGAELASLYWTWLDGAWGPLVRVRTIGERVVILQAGAPGSYQVIGGALARPGGQFRFSAGQQGSVASLTGFRPRLPLWIYRLSHGPMHRWTMARFGRHLNALESHP